MNFVCGVIATVACSSFVASFYIISVNNLSNLLVHTVNRPTLSNWEPNRQVNSILSNKTYNQLDIILNIDIIKKEIHLNKFIKISYICLHNN